MIKCIYTTHKRKKLKTWLDGFVRMRGRRFLLYDAEKMNIHSSSCKALDTEMETAEYLIYVENFEDSSEGRDDSVSKVLDKRDHGNVEIKVSVAKQRQGDAEEHPYSEINVSKPRGRSNEEIIDLFKHLP